MEKVILTQNGLNNLKKDLEVLYKIKRPEIIEEMKKAQSDNNCALSENTEYLDASESLNRIENKITEIEGKIRNSRVINIEDLKDDGKVKFGTTVHLFNVDDNKEMTFQIVGVDESDVKNGFISYKSPLAIELMNLMEGDFIECANKEYEILSVKLIK